MFPQNPFCQWSSQKGPEGSSHKRFISSGSLGKVTHLLQCKQQPLHFMRGDHVKDLTEVENTLASG